MRLASNSQNRKGQPDCIPLKLAPGPAPGLFRNVAAHEFFTNYITFTVQRGQDLNAAAKLIMFEYEGRLSETKKRNMDQFTRDAARPDRAKLVELAARRVIDSIGSMTEIFLPKDRLLGSAGTVPVYYWFVRSAPAKSQQLIRQFLIDFERARKENRELSVEDPGSRSIDRKLIDFDNFNRSTNDQASHIGRYEILRAKFAEYVAASKQQSLL
jgi:hypothetical protein